LRQADDRHSAGNVLVTALTTTLGLIGPLRSKQSSALLFSSDHLIDLGLSVLWRKIRRSQCPLLAHSRHALVHCKCPLSGVKRTWLFAAQMSAYDPKQTTVLGMRR